MNRESSRETAEVIRAKARRTRIPGLSRQDVEQELHLHVLVQAAKYEPGRGTSWECWLSYILDKRLTTLWRAATAEKRSPHREECSLNDGIVDGHGGKVERHQTMPDQSADSQRDIDMKHDLRTVLESLEDPTLKAIAFGLITNTKHAVGKELGLSCREVASKVDELRLIFEDAGLRDYL